MCAQWANKGGSEGGKEEQRNSWMLIDELMNQNSAVAALGGDERKHGGEGAGGGSDFAPAIAPWMQSKDPKAKADATPAGNPVTELQGEELDAWRANREKQERFKAYGSNGPPGPLKLAKEVKYPLVLAVLRMWGKLIDIENFEVITGVLTLAEKQDLEMRLGLFNVWNAKKVTVLRAHTLY
jgi:hypothetical protein